MLKIVLSTALAFGLVGLASVAYLSCSDEADGGERIARLEGRLLALESDVTRLHGERGLIDNAVERGRAVAKSRARSGAAADEDVDVVAEIKDTIDWLAELSGDVQRLDGRLRSLDGRLRLLNGRLRSLDGRLRLLTVRPSVIGGPDPAPDPDTPVASSPATPESS